MKHRGGRSLTMLPIVLACVAVPAVAALEYTGPALHYHFTLPEGWVRIPDIVVKQTMQTVMKNMGAQRPEYTAGFQTEADDFFTCPYMLVQEFPVENMALSDIAAQIDDSLKGSLQTLDADETLQNIGIGSAVIDTRRNMVLTNMQIEVKDLGPLRVLTVSCPGRKGIAQLHFYALEDDYETYAPVFEQILDSFAFENGSESRKPLMAGRPWLRGMLAAVAALSITGAVISVIVAAANRKGKAGNGGGR